MRNKTPFLSTLDGLFTHAMNHRMGGVSKEWHKELAKDDEQVLGSAIATLQTLRNEKLLELLKGPGGLFRLLHIPRPLGFSGLLYTKHINKVQPDKEAITKNITRGETVTGMVALTGALLEQAESESTAFGAAGRLLSVRDLTGGSRAARDMNSAASEVVKKRGRHNTALLAPRLAALTVGRMQKDHVQSRPMLAGVMLLHAKAYEATGRNSDFYLWSEKVYQGQDKALIASLDDLEPQELHLRSAGELPEINQLIAQTAMKHLTIELSSIIGGRPRVE